MNDQKIRILIETVLQGRGTEEAIRAKKELNRLAEEGNAIARQGLETVSERRSTISTEGAKMSRRDAARVEAQYDLANEMANAREKGEAGRRERAKAMETAQQQAISDTENKRQDDLNKARAKALANPPPVIQPPGEEESSAFGGLSLGKLSRFTGGVLAIGTAVRTVLGMFREWNESIKEMVIRSLGYELIGTRIESVAIKTRQVVERNKDFTQSLAQVERQVKTVALEIAHLTEIQNVQLQVQNKLAEATMNQQLASAALRNLYNPIGQIKEEMEIRKAALERQLALERALEQVKIQTHEREAIRAKERANQYAEEAALIKKSLPDLERRADKDQAVAESVAEDTKASVAEKKKELALVERIADGKATQSDYKAYRHYRAAVNEGINPTDADARAADYDHSQEAAAARVKTLRENIAVDENTRITAAQVARESAARLARQQKRLGFAQDETLGGETESKKAAEAADQARKVREEEEKARQKILDILKDTVEKEGQKQMLQSTPPQSISVPGGGVYNQNSEMLEKLERIATTQDAMLNVWMTGAGAAPG